MTLRLITAGHLVSILSPPLLLSRLLQVRSDLNGSWQHCHSCQTTPMPIIFLVLPLFAAAGFPLLWSSTNPVHQFGNGAQFSHVKIDLLMEAIAISSCKREQRFKRRHFL
ncbi:hypothetical protein TIFTF001_021187 [Ficus carica]|uniref:Uncharacterized protein n=1 Tax=Ficus carica TaxID=3494 RepID=A0AA88DBN1_FICCA|nr:hypothetical protein TIFTF001_021187 [Ficus carica]